LIFFQDPSPAREKTSQYQEKIDLHRLASMNLKSLLLSSDEKTVRILRRVLSDLEITVEHSSGVDDAIRRITRQRYEAIIVDASNVENATNVLKAAQAAPVNKRALAIVLVESSVGLKGGFEMGAHFVLHKPFAVERAKSSFRAVRALMKRERRVQLRVPVQVAVECQGASHYKAKTLDICEGGMALQFSRRPTNETALRFALTLPGMEKKLEIIGELAWEGNEEQAGVRFKNATDEQKAALRQWLAKHLPAVEAEEPLNCRLRDLTVGGCYLTTNSPFPRGTRVILSIKTTELELRATGVVLVTHPEFGMGVQFFQTTQEQREHVQRMITILRANGDASPELQVEPDGLEIQTPADSSGRFQVFASQASAGGSDAGPATTDDVLVDLFRNQYQIPVESFMELLRAQRAGAHAQAAVGG
jgi:DNA-binding response OmpR family regulator